MRRKAPWLPASNPRPVSHQNVCLIETRFLPLPANNGDRSRFSNSLKNSASAAKEIIRRMEHLGANVGRYCRISFISSLHLVESPWTVFGKSVTKPELELTGWTSDLTQFTSPWCDIGYKPTFRMKPKCSFQWILATPASIAFNFLPAPC